MKMRMLLTGSRGFTLVELIVVIVIISVLAGMIGPRIYGAGNSAQLRSSARRFLAAAQYARDFATTRRRQCQLIIDTNQHQYSLACQKSPSSDPQKFAGLTSGVAKPERLPEGVEFGRLRIEHGQRLGWPSRQGDHVMVTFDPDGQADAAVVEITDGRRTYSILIAPYTGYAKLVDGTVSELPNDRVDLDE